MRSGCDRVRWERIMMADVWRFEWLAVVVAVGAIVVYVLGPLLLLANYRMSFPPEIVYFDAKSPKLPAEIAGFLGPAREEVVELGFRPVTHFCLPNAVTNVQSFSVMLVNDETLDGAMISCIYGRSDSAAGTNLNKVHYLEFITRFRDGVCLQTTNSPVVGAFRKKPDDHTVHFWDVRHPAELYRLHQQI